MKPFDGGGWKNVSRVTSPEELIAEYDKTSTLCMTLQESIEFDQFVRCYCIGQQEVMIMPYDPRKAYLSGEQYINDPNYLAPEMSQRVVKDVRTLCTALGYDLNTVEFAIKDGIPYAIDFMNPAPDAELQSVGEFYHGWVTEAVTNLVFRRLSETTERPRYRWDAFLNPEPTRIEAVASVPEQAGRTVAPKAPAQRKAQRGRGALRRKIRLKKLRGESQAFITGLRVRLQSGSGWLEKNPTKVGTLNTAQASLVSARPLVARSLLVSSEPDQAIIEEEANAQPRPATT